MVQLIELFITMLVIKLYPTNISNKVPGKQIRKNCDKRIYLVIHRLKYQVLQNFITFCINYHIQGGTDDIQSADGEKFKTLKLIRN
jgi:hypothetical protein